MSDENKVYFSATDPEGRIIDLHEDTWYHIKDGHPEISRPSKVKSTIQKPDLITENTSRTSLAYTKLSPPDLNINVYTKMDSTYEKGRVSTAFKTRKLPRGDVIWVKRG